MAQRYAEVARVCERILKLGRPPVALARVPDVPAGVARFEGVAPSSCSFWRHAEQGLFVARDADHMNCPIGAMTMGFELTAEAKAKKLGMPLGTISGSWDQAKALYDRGYQLITLISDSVLLSRVGAETMAKFREAFPD